MDFEFNEEQGMLRDTTRQLLRDQAPIEVIRTQLDDGDRIGPDTDSELWRLGAGVGWAGLGLPARHGGSEQGLVELAIIAQELGRFLARVPFLPTVLVGNAIARGGTEPLQAEVLPALGDGSSVAAWAFCEPDMSWEPAGIKASAATSTENVVLRGVKTAVQDGSSADWLLVSARQNDDGEVHSFLVDRDTPGLTVRTQRVLDLTRRLCEVELDDVRIPTSRRIAGGQDVVQRLLDEAAVLVCAESVGIGERLIELTVDHVKAREQFGKPIGSFQAVKQKAATMAMMAQGAFAATYLAAMSADAGLSEANTRACAAKAFVSDAVSQIASDALQLHGGVGFTWEHDLHLYLRRAKVNEFLYGDVATQRKRLCGLLQGNRVG